MLKTIRIKKLKIKFPVTTRENVQIRIFVVVLRRDPSVIRTVSVLCSAITSLKAVTVKILAEVTSVIVLRITESVIL